MTLEARRTMTPAQEAEWRQRCARGEYGRFPVEYHAESVITLLDWQAAYGRLYLAGEQMALVLEGLLAGKVNRREVTDALHAWRQCAKGDV